MKYIVRTLQPHDRYLPTAESVAAGAEYNGRDESGNSEQNKVDCAEQWRQALNLVVQVTLSVADVGITRRRRRRRRPSNGTRVEHVVCDPA